MTGLCAPKVLRQPVVRLALPSPFSPPRFRRLELEVTTPALTPRVLFVGRITPF